MVLLLMCWIIKVPLSRVLDYHGVILYQQLSQHMHAHMIYCRGKRRHPLTVGTTVMKNCDPLVLGPALAMLTVNARSCFKVGWNSSSNSPPHIDSPPLPVPAVATQYKHEREQQVCVAMVTAYQ